MHEKWIHELTLVEKKNWIKKTNDLNLVEVKNEFNWMGNWIEDVNYCFI